MIVASITDRLGNQLFQYAAARGIAEKNNTVVKIDRRYYGFQAPKGFRYELGAFNIPQDFVTKSEIREYTGMSDHLLHKVIRRVNRQHQVNNNNYIYQEKFFQYDEAVNHQGDKMYLRGYWQSFRYFQHIGEKIRKEFSPRLPVNRTEDPFASQILNSNAVCISVRRGDHFTNKVIGNKYGLVDKSYYDKGLKIISAKEKDIVLYIFSDDIEWCMANLDFAYPTVFVKHSFKEPRVDYYLQLMAMCRHFIIPVSTFPWWGAWLSSHENKIVIAPRIWFTDPSINTNDLFPEEWIRL